MAGERGLRDLKLEAEDFRSSCSEDVKTRDGFDVDGVFFIIEINFQPWLLNKKLKEFRKTWTKC